MHHNGHNGPGLGGPNTSRSLHIPSFVRGGIHTRPISITSVPARNPAHKLFTQSRSILARFFDLLTAPGLRAPYAARSMHSGIGSRATSATIQNGLSFPMRTAFNRTLHKQKTFLPRGPAPVARMTQVGLGTARNFCSGRPIFQNLVENVPVVSRAFYEVDWDLNMRKENQRMRMLVAGKKKPVQKSRELSKPKESLKKPILENVEVNCGEELERYFVSPPTPTVTSYLLIPLAPTPTSRTPLPPFPSDSNLLPLSYLGSLHVSHEMHALRVSTLFTRLDQANVWAHGGVKCTAYSQNGEKSGEGVCTILKVEFTGWSAAEVRSVIGECGSGWCVLEEIREDDSDHDVEEDILSDDTSSILSGRFEDRRDSPNLGSVMGTDDVEPSQTLIMPTLDFSSSFLASSTPSSPSSQRLPPGMHMFPQGSEYDDPWLDTSSSASSSSSELSSWVEAPSTNGWSGFGLSSEFANRSYQYEPRESLFY